VPGVSAKSADVPLVDPLSRGRTFDVTSAQVTLPAGIATHRRRLGHEPQPGRPSSISSRRSRLGEGPRS